MTQSLITLPIATVLQELSLARTHVAFAESLEAVLLELCGAEDAYYFSYDAGESKMTRLFGQASSDCDESTLPGSAILNCETLLYSQEPLPIPGFSGEIQEAVAIPLKLYGSTVGALVLLNPQFTLDWDELAQIAALAREFVLRGEDLAVYSQKTEELLLTAVEQIRPSCPGHITRVAQLATEISKLMDLSTQSRQLVWRAAQYHDVGKLALASQDSNDQEKFHPAAGADYLSQTRQLRDLAPLVAAHHERYDGTGFPRGLKGDEVPVEAWILALAEDLEELSSRLPDQSVRSRIEAFFAGPALHHHPAAIDALGGLLISGRLEHLLS